ncbi:MAG: hypothetical protein QM817_05735 [Archangium sp.]
MVCLSIVACGPGPNGPDGGNGGGGGTTGGGGSTGGGGTTGGGTGGGSSSGLETEHGGQNIAQWMKAYWAWSLSGGAADAGRSADMLYLPLPAAVNLDGGAILTGTIAVTIDRADSFALPMYVYNGERYLPDSGLPDDPTTFPADSDYTTSAQQLTLTIDGTKVIDTARGDSLTPYFFPAQLYPAMIPYAQPTSYGAIGAIWTKGLGVLHTPLTPGVHAMRLQTLNTTHMFGFDNTWNITVR